jgi:hypothetical protein
MQPKIFSSSALRNSCPMTWRAVAAAKRPKSFGVSSYSSPSSGMGMRIRPRWAPDLGLVTSPHRKGSCAIIKLDASVFRGFWCFEIGETQRFGKRGVHRFGIYSLSSSQLVNTRQVQLHGARPPMKLLCAGHPTGMVCVAYYSNDSCRQYGTPFSSQLHIDLIVALREV